MSQIFYQTIIQFNDVESDSCPSSCKKGQRIENKGEKRYGQLANISYLWELINILGTNDPFVTIGLGKEKFQTSVVEKTTENVDWMEQCELWVIFSELSPEYFIIFCI